MSRQIRQRRFVSISSTAAPKPPSIVDALVIFPMLGWGAFLHFNGYIEERKEAEHKRDAADASKTPAAAASSAAGVFAAVAAKSTTEERSDAEGDGGRDDDVAAHHD